jgi:GNAT superfamily N-acetyltransferase
MNLEFKFITPQNILSIMPLLTQVNKKDAADVLEKRLLEMVQQNYKCLGIYDEEKLIGICGLWFMTRHYCGRSMEPDHVMIDPAYQGKGIGKQLFEWLFRYADQNGIEATELNTYVNNHGSHKFYFNLGYIIKGYHFVRFKE